MKGLSRMRGNSHVRFLGEGLAVMSSSYPIRVPVIAGGLLRDKADVMAAMRAGASAVSTSAPELWDI